MAVVARTEQARHLGRHGAVAVQERGRNGQRGLRVAEQRQAYIRCKCMAPDMQAGVDRGVDQVFETGRLECDAVALDACRLQRRGVRKACRYGQVGLHGEIADEPAGRIQGDLLPRQHQHRRRQRLGSIHGRQRLERDVECAHAGWHRDVERERIDGIAAPVDPASACRDDQARQRRRFQRRRMAGRFPLWQQQHHGPGPLHGDRLPDPHDFMDTVAGVDVELHRSAKRDVARRGNGRRRGNWLRAGTGVRAAAGQGQQQRAKRIDGGRHRDQCEVNARTIYSVSSRAAAGAWPPGLLSRWLAATATGTTAMPATCTGWSTV